MRNGAQFRIVGLLSANDTQKLEKTESDYRSNAQGRGFSVLENGKRLPIRKKNIIRVHVIENVEDIVNDKSLDAVDRIFMIETKTNRPIKQIKSEFIKIYIISFI